jgi:hypothetical protein
LLDEPEFGYSAVQEKVVKSKAAAVETLLSEFSVSAQVVAAGQADFGISYQEEVTHARAEDVKTKEGKKLRPSESRTAADDSETSADDPPHLGRRPPPLVPRW